MYILIIIINAYFLKIDILTLVHKNGHNLTCDQHFFLKLSPLCSTQSYPYILRTQFVVPFLIAGLQKNLGHAHFMAVHAAVTIDMVSDRPPVCIILKVEMIKQL